MKSFDYVKRVYGVPAARGRRVLFNRALGVVTSGDGAHIRVRLDGAKNSVPCHPTWEMIYLDNDGKQIFPVIEEANPVCEIIAPGFYFGVCITDEQVAQLHRLKKTDVEPTGDNT